MVLNAPIKNENLNIFGTGGERVKCYRIQFNMGIKWLVYKRVYLPLHKITNPSFHIQRGRDILWNMVHYLAQQTLVILYRCACLCLFLCGSCLTYYYASYCIPNRSICAQYVHYCLIMFTFYLYTLSYQDISSAFLLSRIDFKNAEISMIC